MLKKISEMTDKDKAVFLEKTKRAMIEEQGVSVGREGPFRVG